MKVDRSEGYDAVVNAYAATRSQTGSAVVRDWARRGLLPGATILDIGCGTGDPITRTLLEAGFALWAVDAAPGMVAAFADRFSGTPVACEAAQDGSFFNQHFDGGRRHRPHFPAFVVRSAARNPSHCRSPPPPGPFAVQRTERALRMARRPDRCCLTLPGGGGIFPHARGLRHAPCRNDARCRRQSLFRRGPG